MLFGADPGLKGGLALYDWRTKGVWAYRIPTMQVERANKTTARQVDAAALMALIEGLSAVEPTATVLELVQGWGEDGAAGAFVFGEAYGTLKTCLVLAGPPVSFVPPSRWKPVVGAPKNKKLAIARATELMPRGAHLWPEQSDDGLAEAALLAYYGAHVLGLDGCTPTMGIKRPRKQFTPASILGAELGAI